ncbi:MAG TPA: MFS transporter [Steroidobacteraceae bacterium]|jgi:putative MFS transporter
MSTATGTPTIEAFVAAGLDSAAITPLHVRIFSLIAAGYFFDVLNFVVMGSLIPDMVHSGFSSAAQAGLVQSATLVGLFIGSVGQGQFTDRIGRKSVYQFNLLLFGLATVASAFSPNYLWLGAFRFLAGIGLGAEQPLCFTYAGEYAPKRIRGRILALIHFIGGACVWPIAAVFTLYARGPLGWRGIWVVIGAGALIVFALRFSLPESPRWLATHGQGARALAVLARLGIAPPPGPLAHDAASDTRSDPFMVVLRHFPRRLIAGMICFSAFFSVTIGFGTWLPGIMNSRGFTITKSLGYTFGMTLAAPCASLFMMYALDRFGRKPTSVIAFILAGITAIAFGTARSDMQLLAAGFLMIFFYQVAGNSMQIFASEVFPTNARASGFGLAAGIGRLGNAFALPAILAIQIGYGLMGVVIFLAILLLIAAASVTQLGPEAKGRGLDDVASPTG